MASLRYSCISILVLGQIFSTVHGLVKVPIAGKTNLQYNELRDRFMYPCAPKKGPYYKNALFGVDIFSTIINLQEHTETLLMTDLYPVIDAETEVFICFLKFTQLLSRNEWNWASYNDAMGDLFISKPDYPVLKYFKEMPCQENDEVKNEKSPEKKAFLIFRCVSNYEFSRIQPAFFKGNSPTDYIERLCRTPYGVKVSENNQEYSICYLTRKGFLRNGVMDWDNYVMITEHNKEYNVWERKSIEIVAEICKSVTNKVNKKEVWMVAVTALKCITKKEEKVMERMGIAKKLAQEISNEEAFSIIYQRIVPKDPKGKEFLFRFQLETGLAPKPTLNKIVKFKHWEFIDENWDLGELNAIMQKSGNDKVNDKIPERVNSPDAAVSLHEIILNYEKSKIPSDQVKEWVGKQNTLVMNLCADMNNVPRVIAAGLLEDLYPVLENEKSFYKCYQSESGLMDGNGRFKWKEYWARMVADGVDEMPYGSPDLSCQHVEAKEDEQYNRALKTFKCNKQQLELLEAKELRERAENMAEEFCKRTGKADEDVSPKTFKKSSKLVGKQYASCYMKRLGLQEEWKILWDNYVSYREKVLSVDLWERKKIYSVREKCETSTKSFEKVIEESFRINQKVSDELELSLQQLCQQSGIPNLEELEEFAFSVRQLLDRSALYSENALRQFVLASEFSDHVRKALLDLTPKTSKEIHDRFLDIVSETKKNKQKKEEIWEKKRDIGFQALECIYRFEADYDNFREAGDKARLETNLNNDEAFRIVSSQELPTSDAGKTFLRLFLINARILSGDKYNADSIKKYISLEMVDDTFLEAVMENVKKNCIQGKENSKKTDEEIVRFFECISKEKLEQLPDEIKEKRLKEREILFLRYCADKLKVPREIAEGLILYDLYPLTDQEKSIYQCYESGRGFLVNGRFKWNEYKEYISRRYVSKDTPIHWLLQDTTVQKQFDADMTELEKAFGSFKALTYQVNNWYFLDKWKKIREETDKIAAELCDWGSENKKPEVCPARCYMVRMGYQIERSVFWDKYVMAPQSGRFELDIWHRKKMTDVSRKCELDLSSKKLEDSCEISNALRLCTNSTESLQNFLIENVQTVSNDLDFNIDRAFQILDQNVIPSDDNEKHFLWSILLKLGIFVPEKRNLNIKDYLIYSDVDIPNDNSLDHVETWIASYCKELTYSPEGAVQFVKCLKDSGLISSETQKRKAKKYEDIVSRLCADKRNIPSGIAESLLDLEIFPAEYNEKCLYLCYLSRKMSVDSRTGSFLWDEYTSVRSVSLYSRKAYDGCKKLRSDTVDTCESAYQLYKCLRMKEILWMSHSEIMSYREKSSALSRDHCRTNDGNEDKLVLDDPSTFADNKCYLMCQLTRIGMQEGNKINWDNYVLFSPFKHSQYHNDIWARKIFLNIREKCEVINSEPPMDPCEMAYKAWSCVVTNEKKQFSLWEAVREAQEKFGITNDVSHAIAFPQGTTEIDVQDENVKEFVKYFYEKMGILKDGEKPNMEKYRSFKEPQMDKALLNELVTNVETYCTGDKAIDKVTPEVAVEFLKCSSELEMKLMSANQIAEKIKDGESIIISVCADENHIEKEMASLMHKTKIIPQMDEETTKKMCYYAKCFMEKSHLWQRSFMKDIYEEKTKRVLNNAPGTRKRLRRTLMKCANLDRPADGSDECMFPYNTLQCILASELTQDTENARIAKCAQKTRLKEETLLNLIEYNIPPSTKKEYDAISCFLEETGLTLDSEFNWSAYKTYFHSVYGDGKGVSNIHAAITTECQQNHELDPLPDDINVKTYHAFSCISSSIENQDNEVWNELFKSENYKVLLQCKTDISEDVAKDFVFHDKIPPGNAECSIECYFKESGHILPNGKFNWRLVEMLVNKLIKQQSDVQKSILTKYILDTCQKVFDEILHEKGACIRSYKVMECIYGLKDADITTIRRNSAGVLSHREEPLINVCSQKIINQRGLVPYFFKFEILPQLHNKCLYDCFLSTILNKLPNFNAVAQLEDYDLSMKKCALVLNEYKETPSKIFRKCDLAYEFFKCVYENAQWHNEHLW